jgi:hypothetical protein
MAKRKRPEFELITIPELTGTDADVCVTLLGAPFRCSVATGIVRPLNKLHREDGSYFDGDFVLFILVRTMFECGTYTMKIKEHLPRLFHPCFGCRTELSEETPKSDRFEFDVRQPNAPGFRVRIEAPAVICPGCGRHAILWTDEIDRKIEAAANAAVRARPNRRPLEQG